VALVIQHARRVRRITLSSVACPALNIFPPYLPNGTIFGRGGGVIEHKLRVLIFSTIFLRNTTYSKNK